MEDERFKPKIAAVLQLLSEAVDGKDVEYLGQKGSLEPHLFRAGSRPSDHRLWLGNDFFEDFSAEEIVVWLNAKEIPALFAQTNDKQISCKNSLSKPQLIDRDDESRAN